MTESVWGYPRPPRVEPSSKRVRVTLGGEVIADSTNAHRVLETSHPPVYYVPLADVLPGALEPARGTTVCEWKGRASYFDVLGGGGRRVERAAWTYLAPSPAFTVITKAIAFYPGKMDECTLDGERVEAQPGDFYGGWITSEIVGPFKGGTGRAAGDAKSRASSTSTEPSPSPAGAAGGLRVTVQLPAARAYAGS